MFQSETGAMHHLTFGATLFNRTTDGRDKIPALRDLIGLTGGTRWADCLFEDGVGGPGKVPFGHPSLLIVRCCPVVKAGVSHHGY